MKTFLFIIIALSLTFCASKQEIETEFPQEIDSVYFQNWIGGQEETGSGIYFHIDFKKPLSKDIHLEKIYFKDKEAVVEELSENSFSANLYLKNQSVDLILDSDSLKEYGNKAPDLTKPKFHLKTNEALLEYKKNNKTLFYKIINPKEKPMIAYPSMNKPKN